MPNNNYSTKQLKATKDMYMHTCKDVKEIALETGVTAASIYSMAKEYNWERDKFYVMTSEQENQVTEMIKFKSDMGVATPEELQALQEGFQNIALSRMVNLQTLYYNFAEVISKKLEYVVRNSTSMEKLDLDAIKSLAKIARTLGLDKHADLGGQKAGPTVNIQNNNGENQSQQATKVAFPC